MEQLVKANSHEIIDPTKSHTDLSKGLFTLDGQLTQSAEQIIEQMEILSNRVRTLNDKKSKSRVIYQSKIGFSPLVKQTYYLYYLRGEQTISIIAPWELGRKKDFFEYIATIRLDYDHTWEILELVKKDFFD
jgi:hypothetical protein